jgi:hypothetical protein
MYISVHCCKYSTDYSSYCCCVSKDSYPWIKGSGVVDSNNEIDYVSFVVEVTGGVTNVKPVLEALLKNSTEIRRRQINLMKVATTLSYGMGGNVHKYNDAFHKILQSLQFHLDSIDAVNEIKIN